MAGRTEGKLIVQESSFTDDAQRVLEFLESQGTFRFPTLRTGLFSAAAGEGGDFDLTGYRSVWVRDNVHIANAHRQWGELEKSNAVVSSLMTYFIKHQHLLSDVIEGRSDHSDPMQRPHIRFDGDRLAILDEKWSHAQNDALGAFLWLYCRSCEVPPRQDEWNLLVDLVLFFKTVQYWQDEDSGHWEEVRKIAASSIGVAVAGLKEFRKLWIESKKYGRTTDVSGRTLNLDDVHELIAHGEQALKAILPSESLQESPAQRRYYDSALLFLIYPYDVIDPDMADRIVSNVTTHLMGDHGIRRYIGDSYWCADYKEKLAADQRTVDFSDNLADRDRLLEPGLEAQWCLFDPIVSIHYGLRFQCSGEVEDRRRQIHHLQRSLSQVTRPGSSNTGYRCPESYFCEKGRYVPNDICPLLWTQANLKLALRLAAGQPIA
jgi:hypothetical protein